MNEEQNTDFWHNYQFLIRGLREISDCLLYTSGQDEVIEIKHTAYSKAIFGKGAIQAARFLKDQKPGMYQMSDVIG